MADFDEALLSRIEDAGLNASAPPQQRWLDGWLVRFSPGKAKRARCINAVARGRSPLADKLRQCDAIYRDAGLPMVFRITRFTQPPELDAELALLGFASIDDTRVMVGPVPPAQAEPSALPPGMAWVSLDARAFAEAVGALRGSPDDQRRAHAERLSMSPVPCRGFAMVLDGGVVACGQLAREADLVGLYDVHTRKDMRGRGLATLLCKRLLSHSSRSGAHTAYLQVDADNAPARRVYRRLGFTDAYAYHYRHAPAE